MRARDFDSRLEVFRLIVVKGKYGALNSEFKSEGIIAADRVKYDGRKMIVLAEQYPLYTADYNIRDGNKVKEGWRVKDLDSGTLYEVTARLHDRQKRMFTLKCVGINPNGDTDRPAEGNQ